MIYITGDTHGFSPIGYRSVDGIVPRLNKENFPQQTEMSRNDYVIVCGDLGCVWDYDSRFNPEPPSFCDTVLLDHGESKEEKYWLDWLSRKPFTLLFCDGNHENFDRLENAYPEVGFHGGRAHKIRENVFHLKRGYVFDLCEASFFVFGGARTHDIRDGIIHPRNYPSRKEFKNTCKMWERYGKQYRIDHVSWWEREMPSREEMDRGLSNLTARGNKVDFIVTHCAPSFIAQKLGDRRSSDPCTRYLNEIAQTVDFTMWYMGHYHEDMLVDGRYQVLYSSIVEVPRGQQG